jgi:hypothetical protein
MMIKKIAAKLLFTGLVVLILALNAYAADVNISVDLSQNFPPIITSVKTFSSYTNVSENTPSTHFSTPSNRTVYIQINVSDPNGYEDININGYVMVKLVLWNTTDDEDFDRFGLDYVNATLESGSVTDAVYTYSFVMDDNDETRLGTEDPPQFYRVKAEVSDGTDIVESNTSSEQVGNYTYKGLVLFDLSIDIPENKKTIHPADSFYATVQITKVSPQGLDDVSVSYSIIDPLNRTVDYYTENVAINGTVYRLPVLYVPADAITGRYTFSVLVMYLGVGSWTEAYFDVAPRRGIGDGGHGGPTTTVATTVTTTPPQRISLEFYSLPSEVYAFQGETKPVMVIIENTGNVTVTDVKLALITSLNIVNILPEEVSINPGEKKVFILEVRVDDNATEGSYPSVVKILSPKVENQASITFIVFGKPSDYRKQLTQRIEDLTKITDDIWKEAVKVSTSENTQNITEVFNLLQRSKGKIGEAKEFMTYVRYNDTEKSLEMAVKFIELGVVELAKIKTPQNQSTTTQTVVQTKLIDLNLVILAAFFLIVLLFLLLLRRNTKLSKQVHEFYDLGRIKGMIFGKDAGTKKEGSSLSDSNKGKVN